jgi:hypothetical protein
MWLFIAGFATAAVCGAAPLLLLIWAAKADPVQTQ